MEWDQGQIVLAHSFGSYIGRKRLKIGAILGSIDGVTLSNSMVHGLGRYERIRQIPCILEHAQSFAVGNIDGGIEDRQWGSLGYVCT